MSFEVFIKSTNLQDVSPLSPGGQPVFRNHDVLERELSKRLTLKHAQFFAEPEISETSDKVDWYGPGRDFRTLVSLDDAEKSNVRKDVASLFSDVSSLAENLESSDRNDDRYLARLLAQALRIPSEESIYLGSKGPILTDWGTVARGAATELHVLKILRDEIRANNAQQGASIDDDEPLVSSSNVQHPVSGGKPRGEAFQIPKALYFTSILTTVILLPIILALLLRSCGVVLPGFLSRISGSPLLSYCENTSQQTTILELISSHEREIQDRQNACSKNQSTAQTDPVKPPPQSVNGRVVLSDVIPSVGQLCPIAICASGLSTDSEDTSCVNFTNLKPDLVSDIPNGYCRAYIYPVEFSVTAGTKFTGRYEIFANDRPYQTFDVNADTYPQQLLDVLERNGHPKLYWVADFAWPPNEDTINTKGSE